MEYILPIVSTLKGMMIYIGYDEASDPWHERDISEVVAEKDILRSSDLERFENMASFRNLLVHYYERIDDKTVYGIFKQNLSDFDLFVERIVEYLERIEGNGKVCNLCDKDSLFNGESIGILALCVDDKGAAPCVVPPF
ncbi:MAG: DUF86 domain-containing protein [Deltaproteobacteria bacterium]|nr:DUF86 domain-containing protein [Deltaproteobacteria bacterium]